MDPTGIIAQVITGLVLIITTIGGIILQIITAKRVAAIEGHVNSEKTAAEGRETTLKKENELLQRMVADKTATAGLLAQAVAQRGRDNPPILENIEKNTAETAINTK